MRSQGRCKYMFKKDSRGRRIRARVCTPKRQPRYKYQPSNYKKLDPDHIWEWANNIDEAALDALVRCRTKSCREKAEEVIDSARFAQEASSKFYSQKADYRDAEHELHEADLTLKEVTKNLRKKRRSR